MRSERNLRCIISSWTIMCWGVEIVRWRGFLPIALVVDPTLITPCMFAHGWGFVHVWCNHSSVSVFIVGSSN